MYVGQTNKTAHNRWREHLASSRRGSPGLLNNAIRKYGHSQFIVKEIRRAKNRTQLNQFERACIARFGSNLPELGYNLTTGGAVINEGPLSPEHRARISAAQKANPNRAMLGRFHTTETKIRIGDKNRGKRRSEETKAKIRATRLGTHLLEATKRKISRRFRGNTFALGYHHTPEARAKIGAASKGNTYGKGKKLSKRHRAAIRKGYAVWMKKTGGHPPSVRERIRAASLGSKHWLGKHHTTETKKKISATRRTPKVRAKIIAALTGRPCSPETRAKIGAANKRVWENKLAIHV